MKLNYKILYKKGHHPSLMSPTLRDRIYWESCQSLRWLITENNIRRRGTAFSVDSAGFRLYMTGQSSMYCCEYKFKRPLSAETRASIIKRMNRLVFNL